MHTVEQCLHNDFYQWMQLKREMQDTERQRLGLQSMQKYRDFLAFPDRLRHTKNTTTLDHQLKKEQLRLRGAETDTMQNSCEQAT